MAETFHKPRLEKLRFEVNLVEHCNLNCVGCDHFSPLAKPEFTDPGRYDSDLQRLAELFGDRVSPILLVGGEPLLHPRVTEFFRLTRRRFPKCELGLFTNGILLPGQPESFWESCRDNRVAIIITNYPIKINKDRIKELVDQYGLSLDYSWDNKIKTMSKMVLDPEGGGDAAYNFKKCHRSNGCIMLSEGRLYTCTVVPTVRHFNEYFQENLPVTEADGVDIHKAQSADEVLDFLRRPIPFCRYCDLTSKIKGLPWRQSGKEITEWYLTEEEKKKRDFRRKIRRFFGGGR